MRSMDSILKAFSIGFLLRGVFSGIFFVIAYYVASHGRADFMMIAGNSIFLVDLPVALFAGVTAYGIHRSLFYGFVEWWFDSNRGKDWRKRMPLISTSTIQTLVYRWNQAAEG